MALNKATLKTDIENALKEVFESSPSSRAAAAAGIAEAIADAVDTFVKSGTVTTSVVGTSVSGGPVTGTGTGSIT